MAKDLDSPKDDEENISDCKLEIIEKTLDKFPGVKVTVMHIPSMKTGQYDFLVAVDEKVKMPWS